MSSIRQPTPPSCPQAVLAACRCPTMPAEWPGLRRREVPEDPGIPPATRLPPPQILPCRFHGHPNCRWDPSTRHQAFAESMCLVPALCGKDKLRPYSFQGLVDQKQMRSQGREGLQSSICLGRGPRCQEMNCQPRRQGTDSQSTWTLVGGFRRASWKRVAQSSLGRVILRMCNEDCEGLLRERNYMSRIQSS